MSRLNVLVINWHSPHRAKALIDLRNRGASMSDAMYAMGYKGPAHNVPAIVEWWEWCKSERDGVIEVWLVHMHLGVYPS